MEMHFFIFCSLYVLWPNIHSHSSFFLYYGIYTRDRIHIITVSFSIAHCLAIKKGFVPLGVICFSSALFDGKQIKWQNKNSFQSAYGIVKIEKLSYMEQPIKRIFCFGFLNKVYSI